MNRLPKIPKKEIKVQCNVRITPKMEEMLLAIAKAKGLTFSDAAREAFSEYITKYRKLLREG